MVENVFFLWFTIAFYSTDFLETCTNDEPHGDAPSVIFPEFYAAVFNRLYSVRSRYRARSLLFVNFTFVPPT